MTVRDEGAVLSTRGLKLMREAGAAPRIGVQIMVQEFDRDTQTYVYGEELWTDIRPGSAHQDYGTGEMEFRVRKPQDSKIIFAVMNIEEQVPPGSPCFPSCSHLQQALY